MSKIVFAEMQKDNANDAEKAVEFFGSHAREWLDVGYRYLLGYRDGNPIVGATADSSYSEIDIESTEGVEVYAAMLGALEQLARGVGAASIRTSMDAILDRPNFIAACIHQGFVGDSVEMQKILDAESHDAEQEQVRLDLVNAELQAEAVE